MRTLMVQNILSGDLQRCWLERLSQNCPSQHPSDCEHSQNTISRKVDSGAYNVSEDAPIQSIILLLQVRSKDKRLLRRVHT